MNKILIKEIEYTIQDYQDLLVTLNKPEIFSLIPSKDVVKGLKMAYENVISDLKEIIS